MGKLNIGKLNIRDVKLIRRLPDELVEKYKLTLNLDTCRYDCDGNIKVESDLIKDGKLITDFGVVKGNFDCSRNKLISLEGCPDKVGGNFYCDNNELTSLKGCPTEIGGDIIMNQEERLKKLQNELAGKKIVNEEPSFSARLTYGNNKELDKLVDSKLVMDRLKAVEVNYGIKKLVCDSDYRVFT